MAGGKSGGFWVLLCFVVSVTSSRQHQTCDGSSSASIEDVINSHIGRLMELRQSDWGWHNTPEVVLSLQLSKQQSFFARDRAFDAMKQEFRDEMHKVSLGKLALYALAVRSLDKDPTDFVDINLLKKLQHRLDRSLLHENQHMKPYWYSYGLAVQAICLNNHRTNRAVLDKIIMSQNQNGSFGGHESVDSTAQMMLALHCESVRARRQEIEKIDQAIKLAAKYLNSTIDYVMDSVWIGNKYSTPIALSALKSTSRNFHHLKIIKTKKIFQSLSSCNPETDSESSVAQRLVALTNQSALALNRIGWQFISETVPIPLGFQPNSTEEQQSECPLESNIEDSFASVVIAVTLSYEANGNTKTWLINNVKKDKTLLQIMEQAKCDTDFDFEIKQTSWGPSVTSVNGVMVSKNHYWSLRNTATGDFLSAGVGQYRPSHDDHILFKLTSF